MLEQLRLAVKEFEKTQKRFAKFGATDTEPDAIFQRLLVRAFQGKAPKVPVTADGWDLYVGDDGDEVAASNLYRQAKACVDLINACPLGQSGLLEKFLRDYCWRVGW